jgi:hypothetical protein
MHEKSVADALEDEARKRAFPVSLSVMITMASLPDEVLGRFLTKAKPMSSQRLCKSLAPRDVLVRCHESQKAAQFFTDFTRKSHFTFDEGGRLAPLSHSAEILLFSALGSFQWY